MRHGGTCQQAAAHACDRRSGRYCTVVCEYRTVQSIGAGRWRSRWRLGVGARRRRAAHLRTNVSHAADSQRDSSGSLPGFASRSVQLVGAAVWAHVSSKPAAFEHCTVLYSMCDTVNCTVLCEAHCSLAVSLASKNYCTVCTVH